MLRDDLSRADRFVSRITSLAPNIIILLQRSLSSRQALNDCAIVGSSPGIVALNVAPFPSSEDRRCHRRTIAPKFARVLIESRERAPPHVHQPPSPMLVARSQHIGPSKGSAIVLGWVHFPQWSWVIALVRSPPLDCTTHLEVYSTPRLLSAYCAMGSIEYGETAPTQAITF
ncbi:hypothetical protein BC834DRAFT_387368 [Gloeopeniophorella convolvens]|nr:hypothetical protein BC834DRAFT_387368 [Gloeopeniophorella convolvens]